MTIARITADIDGDEVELSIGYELFGEGRPWVLTPGGGFFSRFYGGIRETAVALAEPGNKVLIWDKPGTGESDICLEGTSVSEMQADFLAALLKHLNMAPAMIIGGSAGSRVSLLTAARHRDVLKGLCIWWITGGVYGRVQVGSNFAGHSINAAWNGGMEAVVKHPQWQEGLQRNPRNREFLLSQDPRKFIAIMERWMDKCCSGQDNLLPGVPDAELGKIDVPALIFKSGLSDALHTRATTDKAAGLLPNVTYLDPPWPDTEWNDTPADGHFGSWPRLAPILHEWANEAFG